MSSSDVSARRRVSAEDALALWRQYRSTGDLHVRNRLVLTYAPLVKYIVYKKFRELPAACEIDDFISCGLEALIASLDRYDPGKGATLEQFVWTRVHGAVLDELRRQDWAPRSLRRWERDINRTRAQFTSNNGRPPTMQELADSLALEVDDLRRKLDELAVSEVTSLNAVVVTEDETSVERIDTLVDPSDRLDPEQRASVAEAKACFRSAFASLAPREREVAEMLYVRNLTLREVGEHLGVSESRACQIHGQLKRTLRGRLADHETLFEAVA